MFYGGYGEGKLYVKGKEQTCCGFEVFDSGAGMWVAKFSSIFFFREYHTQCDHV